MEKDGQRSTADEWMVGGERMEGIFKKVLNFPCLSLLLFLHFYRRSMDEKVLTLYFIRDDPMSYQIRKIPYRLDFICKY